MHCDALKPGAVVVLVDDVVATGKTLQGAIELVGALTGWVGLSAHLM